MKDLEEEELDDDLSFDFTPEDYVPDEIDEHRRQWCLKFAGTFAPAYDKILVFAEACEMFLKTGETTGLRVVKGGK